MKSLLIISVLFLLVSCNSGSSGPSADFEPLIAGSEPMTESLKSGTDLMAREVVQAVDRSQKLIKTGGLTFESQNVEATYTTVMKMLPQYNAFIENENQSKSEQRISYDLSIRVPAKSYDSLYNALATMVQRVEHKYSNSADVTERYYDLESRIRNKKALEQRYLDILTKATLIKDILEVERNLNEVRTEIEQLQGQFNYLEKQVSLSTIQLSFYEKLPYVYDSSPRKGFWARMLSALSNGWQGFLFFLVGLVTLWPFGLLIIGGIFLFRILRKRWKKK